MFANPRAGMPARVADEDCFAEHGRRHFNDIVEAAPAIDPTTAEPTMSKDRSWLPWAATRTMAASIPPGNEKNSVESRPASTKIPAGEPRKAMSRVGSDCTVET